MSPSGPENESEIPLHWAVACPQAQAHRHVTATPTQQPVRIQIDSGIIVLATPVRPSHSVRKHNNMRRVDIDQHSVYARPANSLEPSAFEWSQERVVPRASGPQHGQTVA